MTSSLDDRRAAVLRAVVEEYIETAQPVGSSHVSHAPGLNVSTATIRSDMAALEHEGFLHQPHTSAGRIPTDKGYRFFVDHLLGPSPLDAAHAERVRAFFDRAHGELEQTLAHTTNLLVSLTDYTAVVIGPHHDAASIRSAQIVGLSPSSAIVVVILSNGAVDKHLFEVPPAASDTAVMRASSVLAEMAIGQTLATIGPLPPASDPAVGSVVAAALGALSQTERQEAEPMFVGGTSKMISAFDAIETVRQVLTIVEQQYVMVSLMRQVLDRGLAVSIGAEHGVEPLASCSVVVAPVTIDGERAGSVGVLGPTRMNYAQALAAVAVVSAQLGRRLAEG